MATQQELMKLLEQSALRSEVTADAQREVLVSEGEIDVTLGDGTVTPNLNKRIKLLGSQVTSVVGKKGDITISDISEKLELGSASKYDVADLPISAAQKSVNESVSTNIDKKADTTYVDSVISVAANGVIPFQTETELKLAKPTQEKVLAKALDTRKEWIWNRTSDEGVEPIEGSWSDTGLSDLDQSKNYTDKSLDFVRGGINLFDKDNLDVGFYYSYETGNKGEASAADFIYCCTRFIIDANTNYRCKTGYAQIAFYDKDIVFISGISAVQNGRFITPPKAKYIGLTVRLIDTQDYMLCKASEYPSSYVSYSKVIPNLTVSTKQISDLDLNNQTVTKTANTYTDERIENIGFKHGVNIANLNDVDVGRYVAWMTGALGINPDFVATNFYKIEKNTKYQVPAIYNQQFAFYDENKVYISGQASADAQHQFTTPANAKYIRLSIHKDQLSTFMLCKASEYPSSYVSFSQTLESLTINSEQVDGIPDSLGFKKLSIIDYDKLISGHYISHSSGRIVALADFYATDFCDVVGDVLYQAAYPYFQQFAFYDENKVYISGLATPNYLHQFTTPANAKYARFTIPKNEVSTVFITALSNYPSNKENATQDAFMIEDLVVFDDQISGRGGSDVQTILIYTSADENHSAAQFKGKNAIQLALDSITDASPKKRYQIIDSGVHKIDKATDYIGQRGYPTAILAKDHVDIIGNGNSVVFASLPYNDSSIGPSINGATYPRTQYQTLYTYAEDSLIQGMTFIAQNTRYALHLDNIAGANKTHRFKDVNFVFKGDKGSVQALGCGTSTGEKAYFDGGYCHSDAGIPFYLHNNVKFKEASLFSFNNYRFSSNKSKNAMLLQSNGSLVKDKLELIGCSFEGSTYVIYYWQNWLSGNTANKNDHFNHAEITLSGYGNAPFLFENVVSGQCLRFRTSSAGLDSSITFDTKASAFDALMKHNQLNSDVEVYVDGRDYSNGYIKQAGSVGLSAYAFGCKDLSTYVCPLDKGINYTGIGVRLGDCSNTNKKLVIIVDGVTSTVTFNKNYTAIGNAEILAEINSQISGAIADLYIFGREYYPDMPDVTEYVFNETALPILKGSVVTKSGGSVRLANEGDKIFGVALDNIPVMQTTSEGVRKGLGRVLKRGYIYANPAQAHFVSASVHIPDVGTRFKVVNGRLVDDFANGKISVDIDKGVVSINC